MNHHIVRACAVTPARPKGIGTRAILVAASAAPLALLAPVATATATAAVAPRTLSGYVQKTSEPITAASGTQVRATVTCPRGTKVVGGGALLEDNSTAQGLNTSNPNFDERTWVVRVNNSDANSTATFRVYAVCVSGIRDYQQIEGPGAVNPSGQATAQAFCPEGTSALGGGGNLTSPETTSYLNSSRPLRNGWQVTANNADPGDPNFIQPYVICGRRPAGLKQVSGPPSTLKANVQGQAAVRCPAGTKVLSGGAQSNSTSQTVGQNSSAPAGNRVWQVFQNNVATAPSTLTTYGICAITT